MMEDSAIWTSPPVFKGDENESIVEIQLVHPLLLALGYTDDDIRPKYPIIFQEGRRGRPHEADFAVFASRPHSRKTSLIAVEVKRPSEPISSALSQAESYAANLRAPLMMVTNGRELEVYQIQPTMDSELIFACSISELLSSQAALQRLISKSAAIDLCAALYVKSINSAALDFLDYEQSEFERISTPLSFVSRALTYGDGRSHINMASLLAGTPDGAIITAPSGYGKSTLCSVSFKMAIEERWLEPSQRLPVEIYLPDLAETETVTEFALQRLSAFKPSLTLAVLREHLRNEGLIFFCDGYDRLDPIKARRIDSELANLRRDFPKIAVYVFTRPGLNLNRLHSPHLTLNALSDDERTAVIARFAEAFDLDENALLSLNPFQKGLFSHPFILGLALDAWERTGRYPTDVPSLFNEWIDALLLKGGPLQARLAARRGLSIISDMTREGPTEAEAVLNAFTKKSIVPDVLDSLINVGAIHLRATHIEVVHEMLANYLRVEQLLTPGLPVNITDVKALLNTPGSNVAAFLMALSQNPDDTTIIWAEIVEHDLEAAIVALKYRRDVAILKRENPSATILEEMLDGIDVPIRAYFPRLKREIYREILRTDATKLGIAGHLSSTGTDLIYQFQALPSSDCKVVKPADMIGPGRTTIVNLTLTELRPDCGRVLGLRQLRDGLLQVIDARRLVGGIVWAEERALSRLRYLSREQILDIDLLASIDAILDILSTVAQKTVLISRSDHLTFPVSEVIHDLRSLQDANYTHICDISQNASTFDINQNAGQIGLAAALGKVYKRSQEIYIEIVEKSFPKLKKSLEYYSILPLTHEIGIDPLHGNAAAALYSELPIPSVAIPNEVSVSFEGPVNGTWEDYQAYNERFQAALVKRDGSISGRFGTMSFRTGFDFEGKNVPYKSGHVRHETLATRIAMKHLHDDINELFSHLVHSDFDSSKFESQRAFS